MAKFVAKLEPTDENLKPRPKLLENSITIKVVEVAKREKLILG